ncbi:MAG: phosphoribosyl-ATP diphosphatase [Veillonella sp.]|nr:phosphoribosyl-ATP diphosphatase [Veillonella sp.]MBP9625440.1 phosphoribosyl-ATP diphosphatase [Veillonella sp.]
MDELHALYEVILSRKKEPVEGSYTNYLFTKGLDKILKKVGEEATEVVIAAKNGTEQEIVSESADLLYHWLVMLAESNVEFDAVLDELARREGIKSKLKERRPVTEL